MKADVVFPQVSYSIVGACFEVYNEKGCGFTEEIYQECLEMEMADQGIPFNAQPELPLAYKGRRLKKRFKPDFLCFDEVVLEIKAVSALVEEHRSQVLNYLNATKRPVALLVNFGSFPKVEYERIVLTEKATRHITTPDNFKLQPISSVPSALSAGKTKKGTQWKTHPKYS
jgi:GxxExxY protein